MPGHRITPSLVDDPEHPLHGTKLGYGRGCHCDRCRAANAAYHHERRYGPAEMRERHAAEREDLRQRQEAEIATWREGADRERKRDAALDTLAAQAAELGLRLVEGHRSGPSDDELRRLYLTEGLSPDAIAIKVGRSGSGIRTRLIRLGIYRPRTTGAPRKVSEEDLRRLHLTEHLTATAIARRVGMSPAAVRTRLLGLGIYWAAPTGRQSPTPGAQPPREGADRSTT